MSERLVIFDQEKNSRILNRMIKWGTMRSEKKNKNLIKNKQSIFLHEWVKIISYNLQVHKIFILKFWVDLYKHDIDRYK